MSYNIEKLFKIDTSVNNNVLYIYFNAIGSEYTELRMLDFINSYKKILEELDDERIKKICFIFNLTKMKIPTNFILVEEFAAIFDSKMELIKKKVIYSIIVTDSNLFFLFFSLFKQFYKPFKPLYLCKNDNELQDIIENPENRNKYRNILNDIKK